MNDENIREIQQWNRTLNVGLHIIVSIFGDGSFDIFQIPENKTHLFHDDSLGVLNTTGENRYTLICTAFKEIYNGLLEIFRIALSVEKFVPKSSLHQRVSEAIQTNYFECFADFVFLKQIRVWATYESDILKTFLNGHNKIKSVINMIANLLNFLLDHNILV